VVRVEGMVQEEAAVEVVAAKGGAGNDLPRHRIVQSGLPQVNLGLLGEPSVKKLLNVVGQAL
jgi:hypothetical protein